MNHEITHNTVMKKALPPPFERAEGNVPLTFLLSGVLVSFHTV